MCPCFGPNERTTCGNVLEYKTINSILTITFEFWYSERDFNTNAKKKKKGTYLHMHAIWLDSLFFRDFGEMDIQMQARFIYWCSDLDLDLDTL